MQSADAKPIILAIAIGGKDIGNDDFAIFDGDVNFSCCRKVARWPGEIIDDVDSRTRIRNGFRRVRQGNGTGSFCRPKGPLNLVQRVSLPSKEQRAGCGAIHQRVVHVVQHHGVWEGHDVQIQFHQAVATGDTCEYIVIDPRFLINSSVPRKFCARCGRGLTRIRRVKLNRLGAAVCAQIAFDIKVNGIGARCRCFNFEQIIAELFGIELAKIPSQ